MERKIKPDRQTHRVEETERHRQRQREKLTLIAKKTVN